MSFSFFLSLDSAIIYFEYHKGEAWHKKKKLVFLKLSLACCCLLLLPSIFIGNYTGKLDILNVKKYCEEMVVYIEQYKKDKGDYANQLIQIDYNAPRPYLLREQRGIRNYSSSNEFSLEFSGSPDDLRYSYSSSDRKCEQIRE